MEEHSKEHLSGLNIPQREAALHTRGPLLIVAGAGAGKTKTITHRILHLIKTGVPAEKILAVTFTNKAAKEMRERVMYALGAENFLVRGLSQADGPRGSAPRARGDSDPAKGEFSQPFISTFHSLGVHIIKENARLLGHTKYFTILDEGDATALIKEVEKALGIDPKMYDPKKIRSIISREKGKFVHPEGKQASYGAGPLEKIAYQVWPLYEKRKMKENALDFDDLLLKAVKLLKENEAVRKIYQERWEYIHIDEYQDTNEVQYLMSKLLSEASRNLCAVGDADQNIYSWRGANLRNILNFEKDYPDAKVIMLEENYRSTQNILAVANVIIKKNKYRPERNLFTKNEAGEKIGLYEALDEADEAEFVATRILELLDTPSSFGHSPFAGGEESVADFSYRGLSQADGPRGSAPRARGDSDPEKKESASVLSEIAILYRANFQSRALEEAMLHYNIPYQVVGTRFFERKEIRDTLAYLRAALNPDSMSDIKRIINFPARGIGKATLAKIFAKSPLPAKIQIKISKFYDLLVEINKKIQTAKASEVVKYVVKKSGIEEELLGGGDEGLERLENIKELATLALKYDNLINGAGVEKLLEDASLASDQDDLMITQEQKKGKTNAVKLMTVHASKGLEFKYVFIAGLEDGLFPHKRANEDRPAYAEGFGEAREEERRLFYVALTRAKEKLFLSFANFRTIFGSRSINAPSEFLADIPAELLEQEEENKIKTIYVD